MRVIGPRRLNIGGVLVGLGCSPEWRWVKRSKRGGLGRLWGGGRNWDVAGDTTRGGTIHGGQIVVKYYEPCMPTNGDCESPSPVCGTTSTPNYRPVYKTRALVPWSKSDPYADVSSFALLTYLVTQCESDLFEEEFCK